MSRVRHQHEEPAQRVRRIVSEQHNDGRAVPPTRVRGRGWGAVAGYWADRRLGITVHRRIAQRATEEVLRGTLAHERAHTDYRHPDPKNLRHMAPPLIGIAVILLLSCLAGFGASMLLLLVGSPYLLADLVGVMLVLAGALGALASFSMIAEYGELRRGKDHLCQELCADLAAVRLVGKAAVLAGLRASHGQRKGWLARSWNGFTARLVRTHPPLSVRIATVDWVQGVVATPSC